jgi:hypothetical protein
MERKLMLHRIILLLVFQASLFCKAFSQDMDTEKIEQITHIKGVWNSEEGVFKISFPRKDVKIVIDGWETPPFMGLTSWVAFFAGTDDNAVVDGDIAVLEDALESVLLTLRKANINIVALHNHMIHENPRILFVHYWGKGHVRKLAESIKLAFDKVSD